MHTNITSTMYAQPDYPAALASLQGMTSDQLKEILNRWVFIVIAHHIILALILGIKLYCE